MKNEINFRAIMFVVLITALLLIFFSIVSIADKLNEKIKNKIDTKITGNVISEKDFIANVTNLSNQTIIENYDYSEYKKSELSQTKSKMIYYLIVVGIIASILMIGITLRSTIIENIKKEEEERRL